MPVGIVVVLAMGIGAFAVARTLDGGSETQRVELVAADETGSSPFMPSVTKVSLDDLATVIDGRADLQPSGAEQSGAAAGSPAEAVTAAALTLYADHTAPPCDTAALLAALDEDPSARSAWLDLMGIDETQLDETVAGLTPLVLARDTAVTNSRYTSGTGSWFQAVLQAGTPVLVDSFGMPRVKCSCGNPLAPAETATGGRSYLGERWDRFTPEQVVTVTPAEKPLATVRTVDLASGKPTTTNLAGSTIALDGYLVQEATDLVVLGRDGTRTTLLDRPVARFGDDGAGGLVYQEVRSAEPDPGTGNWTLFESTPVDEREATIWYLPAGEAQPRALFNTDQPERHWFVLGGAGSLAGRPAIVYNTVDRDPARGEDDEFRGSTFLRYLDDGSEHELRSEISYYEGAPFPASIAGDRVAVDASYEYGAWSLFDPRGRPISSGCPDPSVMTSCESTSALRSSTEFFALHSEDSGSFFYTTKLVSTGTGETTRQLHGNPEPEAGNPPTDVDAAGDQAVVSWRSVGRQGARRTLRVDLSTDIWTEIDAVGETRLLRAPLIRPVVAAQTDKNAPGGGPEEGAPGWKVIANATIPPLCTHDAARLVDGVQQGIAEDQGAFELLERLPAEDVPGFVRGLSSPDGGPLTAVVATCYAGGVGWPNPVLLFGSGGTFYAASDLSEPADLWTGSGLTAPGRDGVRRVQVIGSKLVVDMTAETPDDASCCPSATVRVTARAEGHRLVVERVERTG